VGHACYVKTTFADVVSSAKPVVWRERTFGVTSVGGRLLFGMFQTTREPFPPAPESSLVRRAGWSVGVGGPYFWSEPFLYKPSTRAINWLGFGFFETTDSVGETTPFSQSWRAVGVPHWSVALLFSLLPARGLVQTRMRHRERKRGFDVSVA
jgi:hypothetical protein